MDEYQELLTDFFSIARDFVEDAYEQITDKIKPLTPLEQNLKEALGTEQHGCSTAVMQEITRSMGLGGDSTLEVSEAIAGNLELGPAHAREHIRALTLIEFMLGHGNPFVAQELRNMTHLIQRVMTFGSGNHGPTIREKGGRIIQMMTDDEYLEKHRLECAEKCSRFVGIGSQGVAMNASWGMAPPSANYWGGAAYQSNYTPNGYDSDYDRARRGRKSRPHLENVEYFDPEDRPQGGYRPDSFSEELPNTLNGSMFAPPPKGSDPLSHMKCHAGGRYSLDSDDSMESDPFSGRRRLAQPTVPQTDSGSVEVFGRGTKPSQYGGTPNNKDTWFEEAVGGSNPFEEDLVGPPPVPAPRSDLLEPEVDEMAYHASSEEPRPRKLKSPSKKSKKGSEESSPAKKSPAPVVNLLD